MDPTALRKVDLLLGPLLCGDVAKLAARVTCLASLRLTGIANRNLATLVGIKVSASAGAVAVRRNGLLVKVVHERTALSRETRDRDLEVNAIAVLSSGRSNGTANSVLGLLRKGGNVGSTLRVAADYRSSDDGRGLGSDSRSRSNERENLNAHVEGEW